jgi:hypothetical protein
VLLGFNSSLTDFEPSTAKFSSSTSVSGFSRIFL